VKRAVLIRAGVVVFCLSVFCATWIVHAAGSQNQSERKAKTVSPRIRALRPVGTKPKIVSGQFRKGLPQRRPQIPDQPEGRSGRIKIPKAGKRTVAESMAILKQIKGTRLLLDAAPVPTAADADPGLSVLLTPCSPSGSIKGVRDVSLTLFGVVLRSTSTTLQNCVSMNSVDVLGAGLDKGRVHVGLQGVEPGWYIVGAEFAPGGGRGPRDLAARYSLSHYEGGTSVSDDGGRMQVTYDRSLGEPMYVPVLFQITKPNSRANIWFCLPEEDSFWFIGATAQRLD